MKFTDGLFFFACVPTRLAIAWNVKRIPSTIRPLLLVPAIGFGYRSMVHVGTHGFFGSKIWWQALWPVHSLMWFLAWQSMEYDTAILTMDVLIGVITKIIR